MSSVNDTESLRDSVEALRASTHTMLLVGVDVALEDAIEWIRGRFPDTFEHFSDDVDDTEFSDDVLDIEFGEEIGDGIEIHRSLIYPRDYTKKNVAKQGRYTFTGPSAPWIPKGSTKSTRVILGQQIRDTFNPSTCSHYKDHGPGMYARSEPDGQYQFAELELGTDLVARINRLTLVLGPLGPVKLFAGVSTFG